MTRTFTLVATCALLGTFATLAGQQSAPAAATLLERQLDVVVPRTLEVTGTPSASVAVVRDGKIILARAWGTARVDARVAATPSMRYAIASITKQFTAAAMLLLQEDGKLSLDDRVSRYLPGVAHGDEVTIRQVLSHTAGYDDYWAQDYLPDYILKPADVPRIMREWGGRPLTFPPGTEWGYSNTGYVIAGAIVEKVSGVSHFQFLQKRIFEPLGMRSAFDYTKNTLPSTDVAGYLRYAIGPLRPAPREADAWLFGAGNLAMTATDLATWDISLMSRSLLSEASYRDQQTDGRRAGSSGPAYGLGVELVPNRGRRAVSHSGGGSGFSSTNIVLPDERLAVAVLVNRSSRAASGIADYIVRSLLATAPLPDRPEEAPRTAPPPVAATQSNRPEVVQARRLFEMLQKGAFDRSRFTESANGFFTDQAIADFAAGLAPLGPPQHLWQTYQAKRGTMMLRVFQAWFPERSFLVLSGEMPDGRWEEFQVFPLPPQWR